MTLLDEIRTLVLHLRWADGALLDALTGQSEVPAAAVREMAHVLGTGEIWLARIEARPPRTAVWPDEPLDRLPTLAESVHSGLGRHLEGLEQQDLDRPVAYANSAGAEFTNTVGEILIHVVLHGQYHRGKINLLLRQEGCEPAPVDYIAWARGAPAATEADAIDAEQGGP